MAKGLSHKPDSDDLAAAAIEEKPAAGPESTAQQKTSAERRAAGGQSDQAVRILGVDPGLNITGYAVIDCLGSRDAVVEAGAIRPGGGGELADRIERLHGEIIEIIDELHPHCVAVEQLYSHYKHPRTSILMAHARGVILLAAAQRGLAVHSLAATQIKKSLTGNGHATKRQMQHAIAGLFALDAPPEPPDVADAMAIALCAGRTLGRR